jgi:hypothetical protein
MVLASAGAVPTVAKATSESAIGRTFCAFGNLSISKICMKYLLNGVCTENPVRID